MVNNGSVVYEQGMSSMNGPQKRNVLNVLSVLNVLTSKNLSPEVLQRLNNRALASLALTSQRHRDAVRAHRPVPGGGILNPEASNGRTTRLPTASEVTKYGVDPAQRVLDRTPGVLKPYHRQPFMDFSAPREQWVRVLMACMRRVHTTHHDSSSIARIAVNLREMYWGLKVRDQGAVADQVKIFVDEYSRPRQRPNLARLRDHIPAMSKVAIFLTCSQFLRNIRGLVYVGPARGG